MLAMDSLASVQATLTYTVDTGEKPVQATAGPGGRLRERTGCYREHAVTIGDGRPIAGELTLDEQGFVLTTSDTRVEDFWDEDQLRSVYYPEVEALIKQVSGAERVVIFDHTLRSGDKATQETRFAREPVAIVHNDYTEWSGPQRVRDVLPDEAEKLLEHRVAVIQVWRPIRGPVESWPLAICDARSLAAEDLIATERRHPDRVGEIYQVAYNPGQRWLYFPRMARNEALVFKCYDSMTDGRARFTAHASFDDPGSPPDPPARESIEMRTLAFFGPE